MTAQTTTDTTWNVETPLVGPGVMVTPSFVRVQAERVLKTRPGSQLVRVETKTVVTTSVVRTVEA